MKLKFAWLILSTMLLSGLARADNLNFNSGAVSGCSYSSSNKTYTCSSLQLAQWNDSVIIGDGYTVVVNSGVTIGYNQNLQMSGNAKLQTSGSLDLQTNPSVLNLTGTLAVGGSFAMAGGKVTGSVSASGQATMANSSNITGTLSAASLQTGSYATVGGAVSVTGGINLGDHTTVSGAISGGSIITNADVTMRSSLTVTGTADLASRTSVTGAVNVASLVTNSNATFGSSITASGLVNLSSGNTVTGAITAGSVQTDSSVQVNGGIVSSGSVALGSAGVFKGGVSGTTITTTSPVTITGDVKASTSLTLESGCSVTGNVSGGNLTMKASNTTITGNVTMTGDVFIGNADTIYGDLVARNVMTQDSNSRITGNAYVNAITLQYAAKVNKTIYCTGTGATPNCSCVTNNSGYGMPAPTCAVGQAPSQPTTPTTPTTPATPSGPDHILITHSGSALTCQPRTVTVTACANSACTAPHYGSSIEVLLAPGSSSNKFTFTGTTATATVQQTTKGTGALSAVVTGMTVPYSCMNTGTGDTSCNMTFDNTGLVVTPPNHIAGNTVNATIRALTSSANSQTCVPLVKDQTVTVNMGCSFINPGPSAASTAAKLTLNGSQQISCGGSAGVSLAFDSNGSATLPFKYSEVGQVALSANYTSSPSLTIIGSENFIAAPASFKIEATRASGLPPLKVDASDPIFAMASDGYTLKVTAVNSAGDPTTNFGIETPPESMNFTAAIHKPADLATVSGQINSAPFAAVTSGSFSTKTGSLWSFNDVGQLDLGAKLANTSGYLGSGYIATGTLLLGRFIPHHFDTELLYDGTLTITQGTGNPMKCSNAAGLTKPCSAVAPGNDRFIFSGQNFYAKVTAYNGDTTPGVTANYMGSLSKSVTLSAVTAPGGATAAPGTIVWTDNTPTAARFSFTNGVGTLSATPLNLPSYVLTDPASPPIVPTQLYLRAVDTDSASSKRASGTSVEAALAVVNGRMFISNNYGSQSWPMSVEVQAQYWTGNSYVVNTAFSYTGLAIADNINFSNCQKELSGSGNTCLTAKLVVMAPTTLAFSSGKARFRLAAPAVPGSVDVKMVPTATANPPFYPYLFSTTGRQTFGVYRSGPVIYTREVY